MATNILTISGAGRSGSTMLACILSEAMNGVCIGQLRDLWAGIRNDVRCSCGSKLSECLFWRKSTEGVLDGDLLSKSRVIEDAQQEFFNDVNKYDIWNRDALNHISKSHKLYINALQTVCQNIHNKNNIKYLIDSSKSPELALAYSIAFPKNIKVLNLIRDPRAVAISWLKKKNLDYARIQLNVWMSRQKRLINFSSFMGSKHAVLKYEDFCADPAIMFPQVVAWASDRDIAIELSQGYSKTFSLNWDNLHLFPPTNEEFLLSRQSAVKIVESTGWIKQISKYDFLSNPNNSLLNLMELYGYEASINDSNTPISRDND
jgi:hypothetical protein